jgi:hypothetical protein
MRKFTIFILGAITWISISIVLGLFAGIGIFMCFMLFSSIMVVIAICNPAILEWVRGEKFTQEQRTHFSQITSS